MAQPSTGCSFYRVPTQGSLIAYVLYPGTLRDSDRAQRHDKRDALYY